MASLCLMPLLLLAGGAAPAWAARGPLPEPVLVGELSQLENDALPPRVFRLRVAALAAHRESYSPQLQGRIARLQCWARDSERTSEYEATIAFASEQLEWARRQQDRTTEAGLFICRGFNQQMLGNMTQAKADYDAALLLAEVLDELSIKFDALSYRGDLLAYQGALAEGLNDLLAAYDGYAALGWEGQRLQMLALIANTYRRMGVYERALEYLEELKLAYQQRQDSDSLIGVGIQLAILYTDQGDYESALPLFEAGEAYYHRERRDMDLLWVRVELSWCLLNLKRIDEALNKLEQARPMLHSYEREPDKATLGLWQLVMGLTLDAKKEGDKALHYLARAESIFSQEQNQRFLAWIYQARARILEQQGHTKSALVALQQYVQIKSELDRLLNAQRSMQIRLEFDMARKELENQNLKSQQLMQAERLQQMQERRRWQYLVSTLVLLVMGVLVICLFNRARRMRQLAMTDELTGIHNRRQIQTQGEVWFKQARDHCRSLCVLLLDIDHFKQVNDKLGHQTGDLVLVAVAKCISVQLRTLDKVGRSGGEEFLVLLPDTRMEEALEVAERIRHEVSRLHIEGMPEGHPVHVSIGCAECSLLDETLGDLIKRADEAMYRAKQAGRNQVMRAE
ncbi:diguanylate cyclase [Aeromonas salmonicida]|uniref:GGDEF domain-containing protein n=1 Tax=Aeromonas salmonicida TaxID=645 RepID=UPI003D05D642